MLIRQNEWIYLELILTSTIYSQFIEYQPNQQMSIAIFVEYSPNFCRNSNKLHIIPYGSGMFCENHWQCSLVQKGGATVWAIIIWKLRISRQTSQRRKRVFSQTMLSNADHIDSRKNKSRCIATAFRDSWLFWLSILS